MVSKRTALWVSLMSALVVGCLHYGAHYFGLPVWGVGLIVMTSVFILAYWGMTYKKR